MSPHELEVALLRGHALHARIARDSAELKDISASIRDHALERPGEHVALEDPKSEGTRWIYARDGRAVIVVCPKDKLKGSIRPESKGGLKILAAAGTDLDYLFDRHEVLVPKTAFRSRLQEACLSASAQEKILRAATGDSEPQVKWEVRP